MKLVKSLLQKHERLKSVQTQLLQMMIWLTLYINNINVTYMLASYK